MSSIFTIARLTVKLAMRSGALWGVLALVVATSSFLFFASTGDGHLVNELQVRVQYSFGLTYSLLTLMVIALSVFTVRSQLDEKQLHMLTSRPVSRPQVLIGQWLGMVVIAGVAEFALLMTIAGASSLLGRGYNADERALADAQLGTVRYEAQAARKPFADQVADRINTLRADGTVTGAMSPELRKEIEQQIRRDQQIVPVGGQREWRFVLSDRVSTGETAELRYKIYADNQRQPVRGSFRVWSANSPETFEQAFEAEPFRSHVMQIPLDQFPKSHEVMVELKNGSDRELYLGRTQGLRLYYVDGSMSGNAAKAFGLHLLHLAVVAAIGLMAGVAFTFPVAAFMVMVLFLLSIGAGFFQQVVRETRLEGSEMSALDQAAVAVTSFGIWLTKGMQPPSVVERFATGISIPLDSLLLSWVPGALVYGLIAGGIGIVALKRKELSKLQA
ncbi:MAG: ABC-type transport system involved in multi-copper enzyme maturation permease subunit [Rhodothermales bacterium]|jgi:ABC-type transport system involved in multi-copper enzyme maturation permease subunit